MIRYLLLLILFITPKDVTSQYLDTTRGLDRGIVADNKNRSADNYHVVTPILLRNNSISQFSTDSGFSGFRQPGYLFASSLILPGSGQLINRNPIRAALYAALEITSIYMVVEMQKRGQRGERNYKRFANQNWSVVQYAEWLIDYHDFHSISNPYLPQLRDMLNGVESSFDTSIEWNQIDLTLLRSVEKNTPYLTTDNLGANNFSHMLPAYGSQQYYELISKYYQYQAGWRDYHSYHDQLGHIGDLFNERYFVDRNGLYASPFFYDGVQMSREFNDDFRTRRTFISLLIVNHFISAFDAYFTISLKQNRLNATSTAIPGKQLILEYKF
tara:strand:+ start:50399 stop:51382 length:984 start_codon:yes stop_codon:yes gene_type:complete